LKEKDSTKEEEERKGVLSEDGLREIVGCHPFGGRARARHDLVDNGIDVIVCHCAYHLKYTNIMILPQTIGR